MRKYQTMFELNLKDLDLVEKALRAQTKSLSGAKLEATINNSQRDNDNRAQVAEIQNLLGKLHNQKIWFTPKEHVPQG